MAVVPKGFLSLTPTIVLDDAPSAIILYKKVFSAKETYRLAMPDGRILHACLQIGNSKMFLSDYRYEDDHTSNDSLRFYLYVDDVDALCNLAVKNGFENISMPPEDMFWGDRVGAVRDKFGVLWTIATHKSDPSDEEIEKGQKEFLLQMME